MDKELKEIIEEIEKREDAVAILRSLICFAETLRNQ